MKENLLKTSVFLLLTISLTSFHSHSKIKNLVEVEVSTDSIDAFLESKMDSLNIPGLSIAVINDGKVVYNSTFGFANLEKNTRYQQNDF
jgi:CubicO group peptidase (beta-lactamase class C family)